MVAQFLIMFIFAEDINTDFTSKISCIALENRHLNLNE
jgi:hypothetical protein